MPLSIGKLAISRICSRLVSSFPEVFFIPGNLGMAILIPGIPKRPGMRHSTRLCSVGCHHRQAYWPTYACGALSAHSQLSVQAEKFALTVEKKKLN